MGSGQIVDFVGLHARLQPGRRALVDLTSGARWTYLDLDKAIAQAARVLRETYGCAEGDRVAALARNCAELVIAHAACARIGAIFAPLNWRLSQGEVSALLRDADPKLVLGDGERARLGVEGVGIEAFAAQARAAEPLATAPIDQDRVSLLLYTSGTSGTPKGVMLSEGNLTQTGINSSLLSHVTHESAYLVDAPMFHIIGLVTSVRPPLMRGGAVLVSNGFDPARTLERLVDETLGVTHYFCVPQMAAMLRAQPSFDPQRLRRLTAIFTGGAPHAEPAIRAWVADEIPIADGFGMSEAGSVFGMPADLNIIAAKAGSAGVPTPFIDARIVDAEGKPCQEGEPGELWLRGRSIMRGYWNRPEETRAALTEDGWLRTGDIVRRDSDDFYFIVDRKKDMFISGGENVYPAEVEAVLADMAGLKEAAVVGVADGRWGEVGVCAYVAAPGAALDADALRRFLETKLARFKIPKHFVEMESLPRTSSGKLQKHVLRAMVRDLG